VKLLPCNVPRERLPLTSPFSTFVERQPVGDATLPIIHTTDSLTFRHYREAGRIGTERCEFFEEELSYYFYGLPVVRKSLPAAPVRLRSLEAVSLIIDRRKINFARAYPFDTKAALDGRFDHCVHPEMTVSSFAMTPDMVTIDRLIECFYGSTRAYLRGQANNRSSLGPSDYEAECYEQIVAHCGGSEVDTRRASLELQRSEGFALLPGSVLAVVVPEHLELCHETVSFVKGRLGADLVPYDHFHPSADVNVPALAKAVLEYVERLKA
jgi:hypothetical protein